jgi:hypothetical protein
MSDDAQTEQVRGIVGTVLPPDLRDTFVEYARIDAFLGEDGEVDTEKVMGHLTAIKVATQPQMQQSQRNWGQHSGAGAPGKQPGDDGRDALRKRHGVKNDATQPAAGAHIRPGADARAELGRRYPKGKQ